MGYEVEKAALLSDAKAWGQAAEELAAPTSAIGPLTLNGGPDVTGLGERMGIHTSYENARSKMEELMGEAAKYFVGLASSLTEVAADYEAREQEGEASFKQKESELGGN